MGSQVKLFHDMEQETKKKKVIGDRAYVFTNWGLVLGTVVKVRTDRETGIEQYKVSINIDKNNKDIDYSFWYTAAGQMYKNKFTAIVTELLRPFRVKLVSKIQS